MNEMIKEMERLLKSTGKAPTDFLLMEVLLDAGAEWDGDPVEDYWQSFSAITVHLARLGDPKVDEESLMYSAEVVVDDLVGLLVNRLRMHRKFPKAGIE